MKSRKLEKPNSENIIKGVVFRDKIPTINGNIYSKKVIEKA